MNKPINISAETAREAIEFINKSAHEYARAKAGRKYCQEQLRRMPDNERQEVLSELKEAREIENSLYWLMRGAELTVLAWLETSKLKRDDKIPD